MRKKALVTGGAGFIGSNLVKKLVSEDWDVILLDNLSRKGSELNLVWLLQNSDSSKISVKISNIRNFNEIKSAVSEVDVVFHLAAQVAVTTSFLNPSEDFEINALGSFNILEAARESGHKPIIVYASTNKVYGQMTNIKVAEGKHRYSYRNNKNGINEQFPLDFHSPYGCSNGVADQYTRDYYRMYDIPTVVFRQSCIYGPRQMGVEDQGWVAFFSICSVLKKAITIYGDGKQVRDLLYIDDLTNAYLTAVEKIDKTKGEVYNIGGGAQNSFSLLEYIKHLQEFTGYKLQIKFRAWRPGDQKIYISDNSKLSKDIGWKPKVSNKEGIKLLYNWVKENKNLFN